MMAGAFHPRAFAGTIENLAARWSSAGPLLPAFRQLAFGEPLHLTRLAEITGITVEELEERLKAVRCTRDKDGRLIDLFGMTLEKTSIALEIDGATIHSCCALWAVMIPKLVNRTAVVRSTDPLTGQPVRLVVSPEAVESVEPSHAAATTAIASAEEIAANVGAAFCSHTRFFHSRESAERFAKEASSRYAVTVAELHQVGQDLLQAIFARTSANARGSNLAVAESVPQSGDRKEASMDPCCPQPCCPGDGQ